MNRIQYALPIIVQLLGLKESCKCIGLNRYHRRILRRTIRIVPLDFGDDEDNKSNYTRWCQYNWKKRAMPIQDWDIICASFSIRKPIDIGCICQFGIPDKLVTTVVKHIPSSQWLCLFFTRPNLMLSILEKCPKLPQVRFGAPRARFGLINALNQIKCILLYHPTYQVHARIVLKLLGGYSALTEYI